MELFSFKSPAFTAQSFLASIFCHGVKPIEQKLTQRKLNIFSLKSHLEIGRHYRQQTLSPISDIWAFCLWFS